MSQGGSSRHLGALLVLAVLPWTVLVGGGIQLVFPWGLASVDPATYATLPDYLFRLTSGLPDRLLAWPASTLLLVGAIASALADALGRGDVRLTVGLLALAGLSHGAFDLGLATRGTQTVVPVGPALVAGVLWWGYRIELRRWIGTDG